MTAIRVAVLCLSAAVIASALRVQRPEMATAVSLAVGLGAFLLIWSSAQSVVEAAGAFVRSGSMDEGALTVVLKSAGIAMISELGVQVCTDAGESALAGRIRLAARVALMSMALPMLSDVVSSAGSLFG